MANFSNSSNFRPGVGVASDYRPTLFILTLKVLPSNHVVVGNDQAQIRFLEQMLLRKAVPCNRVTDESLLGQQNLLLQVFTQHSLDLSLDVSNKTAIWSADPIEKGSAAINALVKHAAVLIGMESSALTKDLLTRTGDALTKDPVTDVRGTIWKAVSLLSGDLAASSPWPGPWSDRVGWLPVGVDPSFRLNSLYRQLVGYTFVRSNDADSAKKFGVSPSKQLRLKALHLDLNKVYATICEISRWKSDHSDPYVCALKVSAIWF